MQKHASKLKTAFGDASGESRDLFAFTVRQWKPRSGPQEDTAKTHFFVSKKGQIEHLLTISGTFGTIWCSPEGDVHIALPNKLLWMKKHGDTWIKTEFAAPDTLFEIWGRFNNEAFAWGLHKLFHWNGATWNESPFPGEIYAMHGAEKGTVTAVGRFGLIVRWDGTTWQKLPSPTNEDLVSIHVVDEKHMLIAGKPTYGTNYVAHLHEYDATGWKNLLEIKDPMKGPALMSDRLFVTNEKQGLFALENGNLRAIYEPFHPMRIECRRDLIVSAPDRLVFTKDGETFEMLSLKDLEASIPAQQ